MTSNIARMYLPAIAAAMVFFAGTAADAHDRNRGHGYDRWHDNRGDRDHGWSRRGHQPAYGFSYTYSGGGYPYANAWGFNAPRPVICAPRRPSYVVYSTNFFWR